jgi:simple sugar transport system permease protein
MDSSVLIGLAGVLAAAAPVLFAVIGETITERAGVINLSLNGSVLLSAMGGFAVAYLTDSLFWGFLAGMLIGALVAFIVAFSSITLHQSQVAVGFVLALACRDLAYFLGVPYMNTPGPTLPTWQIPLLKDIPLLGPLFFRLDIITYLSYIVIVLAWLWIFRTRPGLMLQGIGDRPSAAFVRGANVNRLRYVYTVIGGAIAGLAGPAYTLNVKPGWMGTQTGLDGIGWIALSITIFGGWSPMRAAFGAYLFSLLQWLGLVLQSRLPGIQ